MPERKDLHMRINGIIPDGDSIGLELAKDQVKELYAHLKENPDNNIFLNIKEKEKEIESNKCIPITFNLSKNEMLLTTSHRHNADKLKKIIMAMDEDTMSDLASELSDQYEHSHFLDDLLYQIDTDG